MPFADPSESVALELSRAEQWVVYHVLQDALRLVEKEPNPALSGEADRTTGQRVIEKIESGRLVFTPRELALIHRTCATHAKITGQPSDRNLATAVSSRIEAALSSDPIES